MATLFGITSPSDGDKEDTSYFLAKAARTSLKALDTSKLQSTLDDIQVALRECRAPWNSHQKELKGLKTGVLEIEQLINKLDAKAYEVLQGIKTESILKIEPSEPEWGEQTSQFVLKTVSTADPIIISRSNIIPEQERQLLPLDLFTEKANTNSQENTCHQNPEGATSFLSDGNSGREIMGHVGGESAKEVSMGALVEYSEVISDAVMDVPQHDEVAEGLKSVLSSPATQPADIIRPPLIPPELYSR